MKEKCAIVIPVYKEELKWNEEISLKRCAQVLGHYPILFVCPFGLKLDKYALIFHEYSIIEFDDKYFKNLGTYSSLLLKPFFYKKFLNFDYILIHQPDVFVFKDMLDYWISRKYDYIGAPWINSKWIMDISKKSKIIANYIYPVGNGGFSLRKVSSFYYSSIFLKPIAIFWPLRFHEDFFWSFIGYNLIPGFKIPTVSLALEFGFEDNPAEMFKRNGEELPFGCHAWEKFGLDFWKPHFKKLGFPIPN